MYVYIYIHVISYTFTYSVARELFLVAAARDCYPCLLACTRHSYTRTKAHKFMTLPP